MKYQFQRTKGNKQLSNDEIRSALKAANFNGKVSFDFIRDLHNIADGGEYTDVDSIIPQNDEERRSLLNARTIQKFIKSIDFSRVPGATPLDKALQVILSVRPTKRGEVGGTGEDSLPVFYPDETEKEANAVMTNIEAMANFTEFEKKSLELGEDANANAAKLSSEKEQAMARLSLKLKGYSIRPKLSRKFVPDPSGKFRKPTQMSEYGQIVRLKSMAEMKLPTYRYKLATKQLQVVTKVKVLEQKQALFLLIDQSASMRKGDRIGYAMACVLNRLQAVADGVAELYVSLFDDGVTDAVKITTVEEALDYFKKFRHFAPKGNGTNIDDAIKYSVAQCKKMEGQGLIKPEIFIVTDGETYVSSCEKDMQGCTLHCAAIEVRNENLKRLTQQTGGAYIYCGDE